MVLTAALAGGLASGCSTLALHPIDCLKTRIQSIAGATMSDVPKWVAHLGPTGLYKGLVPAVAGSALSHGVRTGAYEATLRLLMGLTAGNWELQIQVRLHGGCVCSIEGTVCKSRNECCWVLVVYIVQESAVQLSSRMAASLHLGYFQG